MNGAFPQYFNRPTPWSTNGVEIMDANSKLVVTFSRIPEVSYRAFLCEHIVNSVNTYAVRIKSFSTKGLTTNFDGHDI